MYTLILLPTETLGEIRLTEFLTILNIQKICLQVSTINSYHVVITTAKDVNLSGDIIIFMFDHLSERENKLIDQIKGASTGVSIFNELNLLLLSISQKAEQHYRQQLESVIAKIKYG